MKKIAFLMSIIIVLVSFVPLSIFASNVSVYCNGSPLWFAEGAQIIDGQTFVPVTGLSSAFAFTYYWDASTYTVSLDSSYVDAWIQANNPLMTVAKNGYKYTMQMSAAPRVINGKLYVPLRTISEIFGYSVTWNPYVGAPSINSMTYTAGTIEADDITLNSFAPPQSVNIGSSYILSGTVYSQYGINRLNIMVVDSATGIIEINETAFNINSVSYNLGAIDNRIRFGGLSKGTKELRITVVNGFEGRKTWKYPFTVLQTFLPTPPAPSENVVQITPQYSQPTVSYGPAPAMLWPVPSSGLLTTIFWCDNPACHSNSGKASGHGALDIAANEGADVIAVMDGVVESQGFGTNENHQNGYGNFVRINHGNGYITQYSHLYSIYVIDGQWVSAGQVIGGVGNTGRSTGNHLDFFIIKDGSRVDPLLYLTLHPNIQCWESCDIPYFNAALSARGLR